MYVYNENSNGGYVKRAFNELFTFESVQTNFDGRRAGEKLQRTFNVHGDSLSTPRNKVF